MSETTTSNSASLRTLLPRLFSKAQPVGAVDRLVKTARTNHPKADVSIIERAYATAEKAHRGQLRKSGEEYITHPVAVAQILADAHVTVSVRKSRGRDIRAACGQLAVEASPSFQR